MSSKASLQRLIVASSLALGLLLLAFLATVGLAQAEAEGEGFETGEVVVKLEPTSGAKIEDVNADYGSTTLEKFLGSAGIYLLRLPAASDSEKAAEQMESDPRLLYAEPNFIAESPEGGARHRARRGKEATVYAQYAHRALNLSCAHKVHRGKGVTVAVLDTGAQLYHPALRDNFKGAKRYDFVDDDRDVWDRPIGLDADGNGLKDELVGHGTHVAGLVRLVAPQSKIMPLRVLDSEGYGNVFIIAEAISYAQRNGADVINLSLSTTGHSDLLQEVINDVAEKGTVVVAAAGNDNTAVAHYPAAGESVLAVTSVDRYGKKSGFASYGPWLDVAAPGTSIWSAFPVNGYISWSGTSMATPFVAGQAALILGADVSLDSADVEDLIRGTARPLDETNPAYVGMLGTGHSDVGASLEQLRPGVCS